MSPDAPGPHRNYEAAFLMALCVTAGAGSLLHPEQVLPNFERAVPLWVVTCWGASLTVGGAIALVGTLLRPLSSLGLLVWRLGLLPLAGACVAYPVALVLAGGAAAAERSITIGVFAVVVLLRIRHITRVVRWATDGRRS